MPMCRFGLIALASLALGLPTARAQNTRPLEADPGSRYYDFWPGTWFQVVNGAVDTTRTAFRVEVDVHRAAFVERWRLVIPPADTLHATALRAWDVTEDRWMYTWISDGGLHQVWDGRRVGNDWYLYREFDTPDGPVLSRQAWIPRGPGRLERISEHSVDGGETWQLRFREEYRRRN